MKNLRIDAERLWGTLMETARIGATPKGGIKRLTLTDLDREVRDWFRAACEAAGCAVHVDELGTQIAIRPGRNPDLKPIAMGSHLDTQPTGGKFDGILGVLAGLEVIRTLNDAGYETEAPLALINWTNEEGARFAPAMAASAVYGGVLERDHVLDLRDRDGVRLGDELERIGYRGEEPCGQREYGAFFELHIEQGPLLEAEDRTIGVVSTAQGQRWYDARAVGRESHAGTTPMAHRKDALAAVADVVLTVERLAKAHPNAVGTVGDLTIAEPSRNVVPGTVDFTLEFRNPDARVLDTLDREIRAEVDRIAEERGVTLDLTVVSEYAPVVFDGACVEAVREATEMLGYSHREMVSGAGHDACHVNRRCPTSMIFVPCKDGISHNEIEDAKPEHCAAGANVLLHAVLARAGG